MAALQDSITLHTHLEAQKDRASSAQLPDSHSRQQVLIYFIPGNPGLIEYYRHFLSHLQSELQASSNENINFTIVGHSLVGFEVSSNQNSQSGGPPSRVPLNLKQQIADVESRLLQTASSHRATKVILIGHSVGAYILMSLLERRLNTTPPHTSDAPITAGICLFPTIIDLHASPNGRKAGWIAPIPGLSHLLQALASVLCWIVSFRTLLSLVQRITKQPEPAAIVTASFLSSPRGVRQAIYLAQHELREMREDLWSEETWKSTSTSVSDTRMKLFFFWAADDHWIANRTRDAVIARRAGIPGEQRAGPKMEIDTQGLPHDFCVREESSEVVAGKVAGYIEEVVGGLGEG